MALGTKDSAFDVETSWTTGSLIAFLEKQGDGSFLNKNISIDQLRSGLIAVFATLGGNPYDNTALANALNALQSQITALQGAQPIKKKQVASEAEMVNWTQANPGDEAIRSDQANKTYILSGGTYNQVEAWIPIEIPGFTIDDFVDPTGRANGYVVTWDAVNNKAIWSPSAGGDIDFATETQYNTATANVAIDPALIKPKIDAKLDKNTAITPATKPKVQYDADGLIVAGFDLAVSDIPTLPQSKITNLETDLELRALDADVVHKTGNETIAGTKTFTSRLISQVSSVLRTTAGIAGNYTNFNIVNDHPSDNYSFTIYVGEFGELKIKLTNVVTLEEFEYGFPLSSGILSILPPIEGQEGKVLAVNATADGYEWITPASGGTGPATTDDLPEGATNQYFTQTRARASITPSTEFTYSGGALGINQIAASKITGLNTVATTGQADSTTFAPADTDNTTGFWSGLISSGRVQLKAAFDRIVEAIGTISDDLQSQITALDLKADKNSPIFIGTPQAPTPEDGNSSANIATTEFVNKATITLKKRYYVSNTGNANNTGFSDSESITPAKLITLTLREEDEIYLKRGEYYDIEITNLKNRCKVMPWGVGNRPVIRGSDSLSAATWTSEGNNIYSTVLAVGVTPKWLYLNGIGQKEAETAWITITARPGVNQITALASTMDALNTVESLIGSRVYAKEIEFHPAYIQTVTAYSSGTITLDGMIGPAANRPAVGYQFKLIGKRSFITDVGEWSFDSTTRTLYVKTDGATPAGTDIRITTRNTGIKPADGTSELIIDNIEFQHQFLAGIDAKAAHRIKMTYCNFNNIRNFGIQLLRYTNYAEITDCRFVNIESNAINIGAVQGGLVNRNYFDNIGMGQAWSIPEDRDYIRTVGVAIHVRWDTFHWDGSTIKPADQNTPNDIEVGYNTCVNIANCGITYTGNRHKIHHNYVNNFMLRWNDGGGIYGRSYPGFDTSTENVELYHNVVTNAIGNGDGINTAITLQAYGIYIDNGCRLNTARMNYVEKVSRYGILCNFWTRENLLRYNTIVDCGEACISFRQNTDQTAWSSIYPLNYGNRLEANTLVTRSATQRNLEISSAQSDNAFNPFSTGGDIDLNFYVNPYATPVLKFNNLDQTFAQLKSRFGRDLASRAFVNFLTFTNTSQAELDIKSYVNSLDYDIVFVTELNTVDVADTVINKILVPAKYGAVSIKKLSLFLYDVFSDANGTNPTTRAATYGGTPIASSGGVFITNNGYLETTTTGNLIYTTTSANGEYEVIAQVLSNTQSIILMCRVTDDSNYIRVNLLFNGDGTANLQLQVVIAGVSQTPIANVNVGALSINTDHTIVARFDGTNFLGKVNGTTYINGSYPNTGATGIGNGASNTKFGIRSAVAATKYNSLKLVVL